MQERKASSDEATQGEKGVARGRGEGRNILPP